MRGLAEDCTEKLTPWLSCMAGTNVKSPHCQALVGEIGQAVSCRVYAQRPSPCREVLPGDEKCLQARARYQLPPLPAEPGGVGVPVE
jgi:uncharacterized protein